MEPGSDDKRQTSLPRAFLADFGLAKSVATGSRLTRTGQALGTPAYMSPEQARGEVAALAPATDVWSLGGALYEMLAGRAPFEGETPAAVVAALLGRAPVAIRRLRPDVPPAVEGVLGVSLAKRAGARYADAGAFRDDLDRLLRGERPRARAPRRFPLALAAVLLALLAGAAGLASLASPSGPSPDAAPSTPVPTRPAAPREEDLVARARVLAPADPGEAERLLGEALARAPHRLDLRVERGLLLWSLGEAPRAREEWARVPDGAAEGSAARLYEGLEAFARAGLAEAFGRFEAAVRGGGPKAAVARGAMLATTFQWAQAREALRGLPGWEAAIFRGAVENGDPSGDPAEAVRQFTEALAEGVRSPWLLGDRGNARGRAGDIAGAIRDYEEALRIQPRDAVTLANLGGLVNRAGDPRLALRLLDESLGIRPDYPLALYNRGNVRFALGQDGEAIEDYSAALRLDPEDPRFYNNRGAARWRAGDAAGAREDWTESLRLRPDDAPTLNNRASVRRALRDLPGAIEDLERALALEQDYAPAHINLGIARQEMGEYGAAAAEFRIFLGIAPDHPSAEDARQRLADCQSRLGDRRR